MGSDPIKIHACRTVEKRLMVTLYIESHKSIESDPINFL